MKSLIAIMRNALSCPLVANEGVNLEEGAAYTFNTTSYNGARRELRMKVSLWAGSMARALELEEALDLALVRKDETPLTETVVSCVRNGGGYLTDGDRHVRIAYYDIVTRGE